MQYSISIVLSCLVIFCFMPMREKSSVIRNSDSDATLPFMQQHRENTSDQITLRQTLPDSSENLEAAYMRLGFSPDGRTLITGPAHKEAKVWDVLSGKLVVALKGKSTGSVASYSPDGKYVITAPGKDLVIWNAQTGELIKKISAVGGIQAVGGIIKVQYTANGSYLLGTDGTCRGTVVDLTAMSKIKEIMPKSFLGKNNYENGALSLSPDGQTVLGVCGGNSKIRLYAIQTGKELKTFPAHQGTYADGTDFYETHSVMFLPDGRRFVTLGIGGMKLWDVATGQQLTNFAKHRSTIYDVFLSPDTKLLGAVSRDGTAILWDWEQGKEKHTFSGYKSFVSRLAFSSDGKIIAAGGKEVRAWDVETGRLLTSIDNKEQEVKELIFTKQGEWLIVSDEKKVTVWNPQSGVLVRELGNARAPIAISADGKILATRGMQKDVLLWDLQ
ncbi:MAG: hypothetical protein U0Y68_10430 [Blastocatellia bacterium]